MRYIAAYLLAVLGGNNNPSEDDIRRILSSVGIDTDAKCVKKVVGELHGKNIEELITVGRNRLASVPSGGTISVSAAVAAPVAAAAAETPKEQKPAEVKKVESEPESDEDMGFGLFD